MSSNELLLGDLEYRNMGLIGNPFKPYETQAPMARVLVSHAEADSLVRALELESREERSKPVWVEKTTKFPDYYHIVGLSEVLRSLARPSTPMLGVYAPLDLFRLGRIRGVMGMVAEAIAARQFDKTLAAWAATVLAAPDTSLEEYAGIAELDLQSLVESLQTTPSETLQEYFGECVQERRDEDLADVRSRTAFHEESNLEREPSESEESSEVDVEPTEGEAAPSAEELEAVEEQLYPPLVAYLIAHARTHASPVIARAIRAYAEDGTFAVSEQLKITKAPKKTLQAILAFAAPRYRKVVLMYDRFDAWTMMAEDVKAVVLGTLSELRWVIADHGIIAMLVPEGVAPELAEQFAGARRVPWDLRGLAEMQEEQTPLDLALVQSWIDDASLTEEPPMTVDDPSLRTFIDASDRVLERFARMASAAVEDAASRGVTSLDDEAVRAGMRIASE